MRSNANTLWVCTVLLCALSLSACATDDTTNTADADASGATTEQDTSTTEQDTSTTEQDTHEDDTHEGDTHTTDGHEDTEDSHHSTDPHWTYEGESGQEHWGDLSPKYAACRDGLEQSPIDIPAATIPAAPHPSLLAIDYAPFSAVVLHNGHTLQIKAPDEGTSALVFGGELGEERWWLLQVHFHVQSEHTLDGAHKPLEAHFVHSNDEGDLAVLGVLFEEGESQGVLALLDAAWPLAETPPADTGVTINPRDLIPANTDGWVYAGSLTTPDCAEGVQWHVVAEPLQASAEQISTFTDILGSNSRYTQPLNDRTINGQFLNP